MEYNDHTVYVVGHAKTNSDNAITDRFKLFFISFVVDVTSDLIVDLGCAATLDVTQRFIRSLFIGKHMGRDTAEIEHDVTTRYFGSSQKAIVVAFREAVQKYLAIKEKHY